MYLVPRFGTSELTMSIRHQSVASGHMHDMHCICSICKLNLQVLLAMRACNRILNEPLKIPNPLEWTMPFPQLTS